MEDLTRVVLFNTLNSTADSLYFVFVFYRIALAAATSKNCGYCCCDGSRDTCKPPSSGADQQGCRKWIAYTFRTIIGMTKYDYFVIFMIFLWNFYGISMIFHVKVSVGSFLPQVVVFLCMTLSYCLVVVSRKDRNDNIRKRRQCCRCHHGHLSPTATSDAIADVETANIAAGDDDEEKKLVLLMNTSSDNCCCCCCTGGGESTTASGQGNCKLSGDGANQDPKIKSITKRFRMIAGTIVFFNLGVFVITIWGVSFMLPSDT